MYGVLYAISPEIFPAKDRGTGNGLVFTATRIFGLIVRFQLPFIFIYFFPLLTESFFFFEFRLQLSRCMPTCRQLFLCIFQAL